MNTSVARKLEGLREDFANKAGHPFKHFYCPILFRDEDVDLCQAHIVNEAFRGSARGWTVQRSDVDSFFGSAFESDFVLLQERGKHDPISAPRPLRASRRAALDGTGIFRRALAQRLSAPNKTAAQVGEKAGWVRAMGSSRRSA